MDEPKSESALLDFPNWLSKQDDDTKRYLNMIPEGGERDAAGRRLVNQLAVAEQTGAPLAELDNRWDTYRGGYAAQRGAEWSAAANDDDALHALLKTDAQKSRDERYILEGPNSNAPADKTRPVPLQDQVLYGFFNGKDSSRIFSEWQGAVQGNNGYDPSKADAYLQGTRELLANTEARFGPVAPAAFSAFASLAKGDDIEAESEKIAPMIAGFSEQQRRDWISAMGILARMNPDAAPTFFSNFKKATARGVGSQFRGMEDVATAALESFKLGVSAGPSGVDSPEYQQAQRVAYGQQSERMNRLLDEHNIESDIRRVQEAGWSPVKTVWPEGIQWAEKGIYGAVPGITSTATALVPFVGMPAIFSTMAADAYEQERFRFLDGGLSDSAATRSALALAPIIAAPQTALERLGAEAILPRLPFTQRALAAVGDKLGGGLLGKAGKIFASNTAETMTEDAQSIMQSVVEATASGLNKDLPGIEWSNGKDGALDGWWAKSAETFVSFLPTSILFSALHGSHREAVSSLTDTQLRSLGAKVEDVAAFREAEKKGVTSAEFAASHLIEHLDATSEDAKAATLELRQQQQEALRQHAALDREDNREADVSNITRASEGWSVRRTDGTEIKVSSAEAARVLVSDLKQAKNIREASAFTALLDHWTDAAPEGVQRETKVTGDIVKTDGETVTRRRWDSLEPTIEEMSPKAMDEIRRESEMLAKSSGDEAVNPSVNGSNEVFREQVGERASQLVQRLEVNQSDNATITFLHESFEADTQAALKDGALTHEDIAAALRGLGPNFDPAKARDGEEQAFRERVQKVISGEGSKTEIRETLTELAVADALGKRKDGGAFPVGSVTQGLNSLVRSEVNPQAVRQIGKVRAFIQAVKTKLRAIFGTVAAIKKARREGGAADFDALIAKITGNDGQHAHDAGRMADAEAMVRGADPDYVAPSAEDEAAGVAFSLSKSKKEKLSPADAAERIAEYDREKPVTWPEDLQEHNGEPVEKPLRDDPTTWRFALNEDQTHLAEFGDPNTDEPASKAELDGLYGKAWEKFGELQNAADKRVDEAAKQLMDLGWRKRGQEWIEPSVGFRLSAGNRLEAMQRRLDASLARDPERRLMVKEAAIGKLQRLKRNWETIRHTPKGDIIRPLVEKRTTAELNKQQGMMQALREDELVSQGMAVLTPTATMALSHGYQKFSEGHLGETLLNEVGRLMSKTEAAKLGLDNEQEYDGAPWLPAPLWGGNVRPDEAAQILADIGVLPDARPDTLWRSLDNEMKSIAAHNAAFETASKSAREIERQARNQAKEEAYEWRRNQDAMQAKDWAPHASLLRDLRSLDAVLSVAGPEIRGKVGGFLKLATLTSEQARLEEFQKRIEKLDTLLEKDLRKEYDEALTKLFKRAEPKKDGPGKKRVGKAGADIHALFDVLREAVNWTPDAAEGHIAGLELAIASGELSPQEEAHKTQEAGLVGLLVDWKNADAARRATAVNEATRIFREGYEQFGLEKAKQAERRKERREDLRADTGKAGTPLERDIRMEKDTGTPAKWGKYRLGLASLEQVLKYSFGDKSGDAQRLADMERHAANRKSDEVQASEMALQHKFSELAGGDEFKGSKLHWELAQKSMNVGGRRLSQLEAITATLMWRQADGRRHMEGKRDEAGNIISGWHYDQAFIDEIEAKLSPEAKSVRRFLADDYAGEWASLNPVYRDVNGIDLPHNPNYSPLTVKPQQAKSGQTIDPVTGSTMSGASTTPGSLRSRGSAVAEPNFRDAVQTWIAHKKQMAHWKAYAALSAEMQSLLGNREVMNSVEAAAGDEAVKVLSGWVDMLAQGGTRDAAAHLAINQDVRRMSGRAASVALVGRISTIAVQATQLGAGVVEMPTGSYVKRLALLLSGNLGWGDALNSSYIQRRMSEMPPVARAAMEGLRAGKPNQLKHQIQRLGWTISGADALFTAGTFAIVRDYQFTQARDMGLPEADAHAFATEAAERITDRLAQPVRPGGRSLFENTATNPYIKLVWAFASESRKNLALASYALANRPLAEKVRTLAYVAVLNTVLAAIIRAALKDLWDRDDEEVFDKKHWDMKRMAIAAATEPLQGLPIFGSMIQDEAFHVAGVPGQSGGLLDGAERMVSPIKRLPELVTGELEMSQSLKDVDSILSGMGLFNDTIAAAASLSHIAKDLYGTPDGDAEVKKERRRVERSKK